MDKARLKQVIIDQKEEIIALPARINIIERDCLKSYKKYVESSQIKVIIGVRRCGKSVLSYLLLKGKPFAYINFDDEKLANLSIDDLNDVLEVFYEVYSGFKYIFLDEVQNIVGWELFVNRLQRQGFNVVVTGSNANLLSKELSTHLTGRHIIIELFPFSFREFIRYQNIETNNLNALSTKDKGIIKKKLEEYISLGGFPDVIKDPVNKNKYLQSLYSDIINKDIIIRYNLKFSKTLKEIANSLMSDVSSYVSFNKIKNMFNLKSIHTALNYTSYLEESYMFFFLPRFSYKSKERATANRKIYAVDSGMIESLGINFSQNIGKIYENLVFLELIRRRSITQFELFYWQDLNQNEVDFVIKEGKNIKELVQVCYNLSNYDAKKREINALLKSSIALNCNRLLIITENYEAEEKVENRKIKFVPLWKWMLENDAD